MDQSWFNQLPLGQRKLSVVINNTVRTGYETAKGLKILDYIFETEKYVIRSGVWQCYYGIRAGSCDIKSTSREIGGNGDTQCGLTDFYILYVRREVKYVIKLCFELPDFLNFTFAGL